MHAKPECFIPVYEPTRTQQVNASDRFASHDARRRRELVPRQIERITGEDVPIVHVPPEASVQDDPAHEASAAEILDDECGRAALAPCGVAIIPVVDPSRVGLPRARQDRREVR